MDRMLPLSYLKKDSASGRQSVSITISGVGQVATSVSDPSGASELVKTIPLKYTESDI